MSIYVRVSVWMYDFVGTHLDLQRSYEAYFKLKTFEIRHMQKEAYSELSLSD